MYRIQKEYLYVNYKYINYTYIYIYITLYINHIYYANVKYPVCP